MPADLSLESSFLIPPQVMSRLVGDETVLLDLSTGIYFGLDGVGKRIWENVAEGKSAGQTADIIADEYEVDDTRAQTDVIEFLGELLERGLLLTS
jgi:hypothetical protein